jgi:hypothetical protein
MQLIFDIGACRIIMPISFYSILYTRVNNPTTICGALGENEPPHKIPSETAFIPLASLRVFRGDFYKWFSYILVSLRFS